ncbi:ROK family protein [Diplocloster modestus]|uniref:ROK family protein n=1 Tax=Diplocloster modestus TaxID=2850322 RepID=A0ABS6K1K8_9FIRM|nr:ROK family protein [Diplocloster modestus]MBU9724733.1 ROK family protein [Diplocloster modestus]
MIAAAIDTGGTKINGAAVDEEGNILKKIRIENTGRTGAFIMDAYRKILRELTEAFPIKAVGIGAGGRIDERAGKVLYAVGIYQDYIGLPMKQLLEEEFQLPTAVTNDCRAGLIGEKWKGSAAGYENVTGIILGTGVGGGVIDHHRILEGAFSGFGEIGHMILHPGGRLCTCGQRGCAEQYISGTALWQIYNERSGSASLSSGYEFFGRVQHNDGIALEVLKEFQLDLASCAVSCANLLDPEVILIGGGLADTADYWWDGFTAYCREIGNQHTQNQKLILAARGNDAALLGAARIAFDLYKTRHYQ